MLLRESYIYHLWAVLCGVYYDSTLHRCLAADPAVPAEKPHLKKRGFPA